jgi:hypothetical protein
MDDEPRPRQKNPIDLHLVSGARAAVAHVDTSRGTDRQTA